MGEAERRGKLMLPGDLGAWGMVGEGMTRGMASFSLGCVRLSETGLVAAPAPLTPPLPPTGTATCPGPIPGGGVVGTKGTEGSFLGVLFGGDCAGLGLRDRSMRLVEP